MKKLTFQDKYNAVGRKDSLYEGVFITAVKTTGIFCRPSCRARKPNIENVDFYDTLNKHYKMVFGHVRYVNQWKSRMKPLNTLKLL